MAGTGKPGAVQLHGRPLYEPRPPYCSGGTRIYGFTAGWKGSNITASSDSVLNQCSTDVYDEFNRLQSVSANAGTPGGFSYAYDRYGNRWQQNVTAGSGPQPQFSFNASTNQISGDSYDAAGNLTSDGSHSYTYDAEGNIVKVDGGSTATYTYGALNRRVNTVVDGTSTDFVFNVQGQRVSEWNAATHAQLQGQYYWGARPVAFYKGGQTYFQHQDWEGTERMRTTYNGSVAGSFTSLAFGDAQTTVSGSDIDQYHFAQLDSDSESDTDHAQFRQYSSTEGHWMSPDPYAGSYDISNPQSMNRYTYVQNSPLSYVDPSGLILCEDENGDAYDSGSASTCGPGGKPIVDSSSITVPGDGPSDGVTEVIYLGVGGIAYGPGASGGGGAGAPGNAGQAQQQNPQPCSQIEQVSKAWHTVETVGAVGVGAAVMGTGAAGWVAACSSGNPLLCIAASEAAPALIVGGYDVMKASWNELQNPNPSDFEGCQ